jgi:hypothetical protein
MKLETDSKNGFTSLRCILFMYDTCFNEPWLWYYEGFMMEMFKRGERKLNESEGK